jgi:hypothetical protein
VTGGNGSGPDEQERLEPGDTSTNPAGASSAQPSEGTEDAPSAEPGSPVG